MAENARITEDASIVENILDGVRYALLSHGDRQWRLGSLSPVWREDVAALGGNPAPAALGALSGRGVWLELDGPTQPLAVMCCGLGSAWPGMGRELYDNFPAARQAMDRVARISSWDILALMDEPDLEKISQTRWQIPYLFLLEYAQWSQFVSLGLKPALVCGHSLGELVALCLAGVYPLEAAWHLLNTRAEHMSELEARADRQGGMLAVVAGQETIDDILARWPDLRVSNRNTPRQFILGGPRDALLAARKSLRRNHVPAFLLNIELAFHNPAMRFLRDLSVRRLEALEMAPARVPMLSCVTGKLYPADKTGICRHIADLDENTVDWVGAVQVMRDQFGIHHFLEIGPSETLCGLVGEIDPGLTSLPCAGKGRETLAMREACARLFAMGHLSRTKLKRPPGDSRRALQPVATRSGSAHSLPADFNGVNPHDRDIALAILAEACDRQPDTLSANLDLRHDLALRSSRFPWLIREAERRLGRAIPLENLMGIVTVGDLIRFLAGSMPAKEGAEAPVANSAFFLGRLNPLARVAAIAGGNATSWSPGQIDPFLKRLVPTSGLVACLVFDPDIFPGILLGLAPLGLKLAVPGPLLPQCQPLIKAGCQVLALECGVRPDASEVLSALANIAGKTAGLEGIVLLEAPGKPDPAQTEIASHCGQFLQRASGQPWMLAMRRFARQWLPEMPDVETFLFPQAAMDTGIWQKRVAWLDPDLVGLEREPNEAADLLALEILYGREARVVWTRQAAKGSARASLFCAAATGFGQIFPDPAPSRPPRAGAFAGQCQYSFFARPDLARHGANAVFSPLAVATPPSPAPQAAWLPLSEILGAMLKAALLAAPWLDATGISDLRVSRFPALPSGITRECRVTARGDHWISQDGFMTRMCSTEISAREISANGRRAPSWRPVARAVCHLGARGVPPPPIWPCATSETPEGEFIPLETFYKTLAFDAPWRLLADFRRDAGAGNDPSRKFFYEASLAQAKNCVAGDGDWVYKDYLHMVEGIFQGALIALAHGDAPADAAGASLAASLAQWRCVTIGYIRFDAVFREGGEGVLLRLRQSWRDERLARFDAQACSGDGRILLTLHHLEFDKLETQVASGGE